MNFLFLPRKTQLAVKYTRDISSFFVVVVVGLGKSYCIAVVVVVVISLNPLDNHIVISIFTNKKIKRFNNLPLYSSGKPH